MALRIADIRLLQIEGVMEHREPFWEERLSRPIDVYPEHRAEGPGHIPRVADGRYVVQSIFLEIHTDEGVSGLFGPVFKEAAFFIDFQFKALLLGQDPLAHERLWDLMYRHAVHGRKGAEMMAISAIDCALWDLKGKWANAPVYRLLGGPTRPAVKAYGGSLGFSVEPEKAAVTARWIVEQGFSATKWFPRHGAGEGREGMARNVELVRAVREAVGPNVDLMLDPWMSWDVPYTIAIAEKLAEYRPRWIEEPVLPDKIESCAAIRRAISIPIATGEHEYTRWGLKQLMDAGAADVIQPDITWAGGLSEVVKICALASTYDLPVVPHGDSVPATVHLMASQPENVCPWLEYQIKFNMRAQFFIKDPVRPVNGMVALPERPGLGIELDESKIQRRRELSLSF